MKLPQNTVNLLATRCHLALHMMSNASGTAATAKTLLEVAIVTGLLADRGYEKVPESASRKANGAIGRVVMKGLQGGGWVLDAADLQSIYLVVETFEQQLESAPCREVEAAFLRAARLTSK